MPDSLNLTFGIELECIISFDPTVYELGLPHAEGQLWEERLSSSLHQESKLRIIFRNHIVNLLNEMGISAYDMASRGGDQKWTVSNDTSINIRDGLRAEDGFLECDVEIKSPAMRFCPMALRRVQQMVKLLIREFNVDVDNSCGFHVHIGNQNSGFPTQTLKHFCMLTAMFEHQLNAFHPAHRIGNFHVKGPSAVFKGQNPWEAVRVIQRCEVREELVLLYADNERFPDRCFAYNLCPMVFGPHKTIEFRQHKGTLDAPEMMNWIQVAGGMIDAMHNISAVNLAQLIDTGAFDLKFTVLDLLLRLKLEALVPFYRGRLHAHPRPEPVWVRGRIREVVEVVPRRLRLWDELERRHRIERLEERKRCEELDKRQELERRRELQRQDEEVDVLRATPSYSE